MRSFRVVSILCICLSAALGATATDNSFKLDFNGDGRTDIALYREGSRNPDIAPQSSYWYFLNTVNSQMSVYQWGRTLDVPAPADYDNDGKTDVGIYRWWDFETGDTNEWWLNKSAGGHQVILSWEPGYYKFNRNYLGDGRAEVGQLYQVDISQNPGETCFISIYFVGSLDGTGVLRKTVGDTCNLNPTPVPGDYNNDGRSDIAVFNDRQFKVWLPPYSSGSTQPEIVQVLDVQIPTPGDFDGDGKTDFAGTKRVGNRMIWRIKQSGGGPDIEEDFGFATDIPVPGDYDGDNKTDIAVWRPSDGSWWIKYSSKGVVYLFWLGLPTDVPLAAPVIPFNPN